MNPHQRWAIDSIEEFIASVEVDGKKMLQVPQWLLPAGAKEGDVLAVECSRASDGESSTVRIKRDRPATNNALKASAQQVNQPRPENDPGGDIRF